MLPDGLFCYVARPHTAFVARSPTTLVARSPTTLVARPHTAFVARVVARLPTTLVDLGHNGVGSSLLFQQQWHYCPREMHMYITVITFRAITSIVNSFSCRNVNFCKFSNLQNSYIKLLVFSFFWITIICGISGNQIDTREMKKK